MSVTIRDIMKLPSMKDAEIIAGKAGIDNVVTAVTVLEYSSYSDVLDKEPGAPGEEGAGAQYSDIQKKLSMEQNFEGSDITITAFSCFANNPEKIFEYVRNSSAIGEAGVIIYYFDLFVKELDQRVIDFADENGYPIIVMPRDQYQLRYSEAIAEISELIAAEKNKNEFFESSIIETLVSLPKNQQNISILLRLLSNYVHLTLMLTESDWRLRAFAGWPNMLERDIEDILKKIVAGDYKEPYEVVHIEDVPGNVVHLIITGTALPKESITDQITGVVRLYLKMTADENRDVIGTEQLIRAIIGGDVLKVRKLAGNMGIDVGKLTNMVIWRDRKAFPPHVEASIHEVKDLVAKYCHNYVADFYSGDFVVFLDDGLSTHWLAALMMMHESMREKGMDPICVYARNLTAPSDVEEAYENVTASFEDARELYRTAVILSYHEILFAKSIKDIISAGEEMIRREMSILGNLKRFDRDSFLDMVETITSFYFDSHMSVSETAENLFIHVNTVKYRLKKISGVIGCKVTDMPEMIELYRALALNRLIRP